MLAASLTLSIVEIILMFLMAVVLGITIHFFITSRKGLKASQQEMERPSLAKEEWKLKYLNDMELRDKEISDLQQKLKEAEENANIFSIEAEELRLQSNQFEEVIDKLERKLERLENAPPPPPPQPLPAVQPPSKSDYLDQLLVAQSRLMEQNQKINQLLGSLETIREKEEKERQVLRDNAELSAQLTRMKAELTGKEKEIDAMKQKVQLTKEMTNALDIAYTEFNTLQAKIQKLEAQLAASKMTSLEYEDLKEEYAKLNSQFDDYKAKAIALANENQQLQAQLMETQDKLKESNFQRQQLQKRVTYLEELNKDMQIVSDANKKLENQLKRISELENMLNLISEERTSVLPDPEE